MEGFSIEINSDLINRLANDGEKLKKKTKKSKVKKPRENVHPQTKVSEKQHDVDSEIQKGAVSAGWPVQHPLFFPVNPPAHSISTEIDAVRTLVQESERVVEKLQEKEESMLREVTERAKDLRDKEFKLPYQKPMPCLAEHDACRACYKEHGNDTLKCGPLTRSYYECARRVKQQENSTGK
ncbi:copper ion binding [Euphorbia peplus]|nr:copper ion binding [Euphorbia peplus]